MVKMPNERSGRVLRAVMNDCFRKNDAARTRDAGRPLRTALAGTVRQCRRDGAQAR